MTLTAHGHHIPRTGRNDEPKVHNKFNCGGIDICKSCTQEATALLKRKYPEDYEDKK